MMVRTVVLPVGAGSLDADEDTTGPPTAEETECQTTSSH
jgi:hypothetical protein